MVTYFYAKNKGCFLSNDKLTLSLARAHNCGKPSFTGSS